MTAPVLYLTVGLPGVGKTTAAKQIAEREGILRLTPDEWMAPLFGHSDAGGRRDNLEGRMIDVARQVLLSGVGVVLDFGCWSPEERWAIRAIAEACGGRFEMVLVEVEEAVRRRRALQRWLEAPETTFEMTEAEHDAYQAGVPAPHRRRAHRRHRPTVSSRRRHLGRMGVPAVAHAPGHRDAILKDAAPPRRRAHAEAPRGGRRHPRSRAASARLA